MERSPAWPSLGALCWFTCLLLIRGQCERGRGGRLPETEWSCLLLYSEGMEAFASLTLGILLGVRTQEPAYPSPVGQHVMLCALRVLCTPVSCKTTAVSEAALRVPPPIHSGACQASASSEVWLCAYCSHKELSLTWPCHCSKACPPSVPTGLPPDCLQPGLLSAAHVSFPAAPVWCHLSSFAGCHHSAWDTSHPPCHLHGFYFSFSSRLKCHSPRGPLGPQLPASDM